MSNYWKRVEDLVRRTGDRVILTDQAMEKEPLVLMNLTEYESLIDLETTCNSVVENTLPTKELLDEMSPMPDVWDVLPQAGDSVQTWDLDQLSQEEKEEVKTVFEQRNYRKQEHRDELADRKELKETIEPSEIEPDDEFAEEQFYLEPIE